MIHHLTGKLIEKHPTHVVIECGGVGYFVNISLNTFEALQDEEHLRILTYLQVREDAHILFGFYSPAEREIFKLLISVSGIGTSTARTMLSSMTPPRSGMRLPGKMYPQYRLLRALGPKRPSVLFSI